ncbi:MAG: DUF4249 family protein [Bacteroidaceae bacterium]|nr:DUF4249 family protein [Bacteroidaceae bacterium]
MKYYVYIMVLLLGVLSTSCERTIEFIDTAESLKTDHTLTINAVAIEGSPLGVFLNRTYTIKDAPVTPGTLGYVQRYDYTTDLLSYKKNEYYKYTAITDARVEAVVNGSERYELKLTADTLGYWTDYIPQIGDHIKITATLGGEEAFAEAIVPAKPKIEVIEHELIKDTIVKADKTLAIFKYIRLKCRISDVGGERYYRLRVRSEREGYCIVEDRDDGHVIGTTVDYHFNYNYSSEDPLLFRASNPMYEYSINASTAMESYYYQTLGHTDTFSNNTFNGQNYTLSLIVKEPSIHWSHAGHSGPKETYKDWCGREWIEDAFRLPSRVLIELQAITPDYYKYLKSVEFYDDSQEDKESAVGIFYNVQNGFGIFGALSYDRHFVEFGE